MGSKKASKNLKNQKMNPEVYKLRKRVMNLIYEAKELDPTIPRLNVRVTHDHERILGQARLNQNIIWISERAITASEFDLRTIVFHEVLHAVYGIEHDESCPLMKAIHKPMNKRQCEYHFKKWVKIGQTQGKGDQELQSA